MNETAKHALECGGLTPLLKRSEGVKQQAGETKPSPIRPFAVSPFRHF
jgi:hypothetical protein